MVHNLARGLGSSSQDINAGTSGREETGLSAIPITPKHIYMDWGLSIDSSVHLNGDTTDSQVSLAFSSLGIGLPSQVAERGTAHLNDIEIVLDPDIDLHAAIEGQPVNLTVKLSSQPSNDVTVTLSGHAGTDLNPGQTEWEFTMDNWNQAQAVNMNVAHDGDSFNEDLIELTFSGSGTAPDNILEETTMVFIYDDENVYIRIAPYPSEDSPLPVDEGGQVKFTVRPLRAYPSGVNVTVDIPRNSILSLVGMDNFTLDANSTTDFEEVILNVGQDDNALGETVSFGLIAGEVGGESSFQFRHDLWLRIKDDEEFKLLVEPTAITVTEGDQVGETFSVRLSEPPRNTVTVDIRKESGSDLNLNKTQLLFTNANSQDVKVTAMEDFDDLTDEMETITLVASGEDIGGVVDTTVTVTIKDDDLELKVDQSEITVVEGESKTFTVSLSHRASEEVTVEIVSSEGTSSKLEFEPQLMFSPSTTSKTVRITAKEDEDNETGEMETLTLTASGGDYEGMTATVTVTITDDDLELIVEPTALRLTEGGPQGTFDVSLSHTPLSPATVNLATKTNSNLRLSDTELTFDAANTPQEVTVNAVADNNSLDEAETITLRADENFGRKTARVTVTITDTEDPELVIEPTAIRVAEGGSNTFTVELSERPLADVTVGIARVLGSSSELTLESTRLTFTTGNWNIVQEVSVTAADDDDVEDDVETLRLAASGGGYNGVRGNVTVTIEDDDTASLIINPTELEIPEEESSAFTVYLSRPPPSSSSVRVNTAPRAGAELSVDPSVLTFTAGDSETPKTVTVTANHDDDAFDDHEKLDLTAFGGGYDGVRDSVAVTIIDNETLSLVIDPESITVIEGGEGTFSVSLSERPWGT